MERRGFVKLCMSADLPVSLPIRYHSLLPDRSGQTDKGRTKPGDTQGRELPLAGRRRAEPIGGCILGYLRAQDEPPCTLGEFH
jgi:hypothetical protein